MRLLKTKVASEVLGLHPNTLRKYANEGQIKTIKTESGQRLFDVDSYLGDKKDFKIVCYCRVSSYKQKDDLERQVSYMQQRFPNAETIKDIGSGINFKRKGLTALLDRVLQGEKLRLVVAYKDRLARFGFEMLEYMVKQNGGEVMVLNRIDCSPQEELTKDLLNIIHVFSCRMHGLRKYSNKIKEDKDLPK
jgi:predicted site-specific integrase-resolvase